MVVVGPAGVVTQTRAADRAWLPPRLIPVPGPVFCDRNLCNHPPIHNLRPPIRLPADVGDSKPALADLCDKVEVVVPGHMAEDDVVHLDALPQARLDEHHLARHDAWLHRPPLRAEGDGRAGLEPGDDAVGPTFQ